MHSLLVSQRSLPLIHVVVSCVRCQAFADARSAVTLVAPNCATSMFGLSGSQFRVSFTATSSSTTAVTIGIQVGNAFVVGTAFSVVVSNRRKHTVLFTMHLWIRIHCALTVGRISLKRFRNRLFRVEIVQVRKVTCPGGQQPNTNGDGCDICTWCRIGIGSPYHVGHRVTRFCVGVL